MRGPSSSSRTTRPSPRRGRSPRTASRWCRWRRARFLKSFAGATSTRARGRRRTERGSPGWSGCVREFFRPRSLEGGEREEGEEGKERRERGGGQEDGRREGRRKKEEGKTNLTLRLLLSTFLRPLFQKNQNSIIAGAPQHALGRHHARRRRLDSERRERREAFDRRAEPPRRRRRERQRRFCDGARLVSFFFLVGPRIDRIQARVHLRRDGLVERLRGGGGRR